MLYRCNSMISSALRGGESNFLGRSSALKKVGLMIPP